MATRNARTDEQSGDHRHSVARQRHEEEVRPARKLNLLDEDDVGHVHQQHPEHTQQDAQIGPEVAVIETGKVHAETIVEHEPVVQLPCSGGFAFAEDY